MVGPGPAIRRRRLGLELRRLREQAGMTIEEVAAALEVSGSKISRIETAQVGCTPRDVRDILEVYGVTGGQREWLIEMSREARQRGWWQRFKNIPEPTQALVGMEAGASSLRFYAPLVVPGLLQTRAYAHAVITAIRSDLDPESVGQRVDLRMERQRILTSDDPPVLSAVIDEAALRRVIGGPGVMREQLQRLAEAAAYPKVTVQVLPFSAGEHAGLDGQFDIVRFQDDTQPDVVYIESTTSDSYLDDEEVIRLYAMLYDHVQAAALDPADSEAFLASVAESLPLSDDRR